MLTLRKTQTFSNDFTYLRHLIFLQECNIGWTVLDASGESISLFFNMLDPDPHKMTTYPQPLPPLNRQ
jgi:hypothetical protein